MSYWGGSILWENTHSDGKKSIYCIDMGDLGEYYYSDNSFAWWV
jgi:hypothetical protein